MDCIGLLTFHYSNNYGAVLQTYATLEYLKREGYNIILIDLVRKPKNNIISFIYRCVLNYNFWRFRQQYFNKNKTKKIYVTDNLDILSATFDIYLVGSDQVWRKDLTQAFEYKYFLDFITNKKKVSYASSFGISKQIENTNRAKIISKLLSDFSSVSVRETSALDICSELNIKAQKVVDPVFLLNIKDYERIASYGKKKLPSNYIVKFLLDNYNEEQLYFIEELRTNLKYKLIDISIPKLNLGKKSFEICPKSVEHWLYVLSNSDYIITESFHCIVFAIIFRKKFICILNKKRGIARIESLLADIGLTHLMVSPDKKISVEKIRDKITQEIDYETVWKILDKKIANSKNYLNNSLNYK